MSDIPLDEVVYFDVISSSSTGASTDADSTPTFAVYEESTDTDIGVGGNLTKRTSLTGDYRGSFTASAANGFELGKWYNVIASATIGGIACKAVVMRFRIIAAELVAGYPPVDTLKIRGTDQTARDVGASVLISSGTGTGQLDVTAGVIKSNLAQILGTALTETAGQIAGAFKQFFNIASPTSTANLITGVTTVTTTTTATNLTNAPTNGDFTATMKASITTAVWSAATRTLTSFGTLTTDTATSVWAAGTRTLTSFGTLVSDIWSNVSRTLTAFGFTVDTNPVTLTSAYDDAITTLLADAVRLEKLLRADHYIDTGVTPWALVYMEEGTGGIGVGNELFRKRLYDTSGTNLVSTDTVVGRAKQ